MRSTLSRLHQTKLIAASLTLILAGILLLVLDATISDNGARSLIETLPWSEFGGILLGAGAISIWLDRYLRAEQTALDDARLRRLLTEQAPLMRDAVLQAFAADHEDLARVANPKLLDDLITNSLALRLNDPEFASEIYTDIRTQAIGAGERWHNASLSIEVNPHPTDKTRGAKKLPGDWHEVTVRWEYTTIPAYRTRRFVCVSDRDEYAELATDAGATSAWYFKPHHDINASHPEAFELVQFTVNGNERPIRRATRKHGQAYTATIGDDHLDASEPVTIAYTYRTITPAEFNMLFFDIEQPTRNLRIDFDHHTIDADSISVLDLVPSIRPTRIERTPEGLTSNVIRIDIDGWAFPRAGVAFVQSDATRSPKDA